MKKSIKYFFASILIFSFYILTAQETKKPESNRAIDSLLNVLKILSSPPTEVKLVEGTDTTKINTLILLSRQYNSIGNQELALKYVEEALLLAKNINYKKGMASGYNLLGTILVAHGDYEKGLENFQKSLKYRIEIGNKKHVAYSYNNISIVYFHLGNYAKSLDNSFKALKISDEIGDKYGMAISFNQIGNTKYFQGDLENSLAYFLKNLKIFEELGDKIGTAASHNNMAGIYVKQQNYEKALENYSKSLKISAEIGDKKGETNSSIGLGNICKDKKNYKKALDNYLKALKIQTETKDIHGIITSNVSIGNVYIEQNEFEKAEQYIKRSILLAKEIEEKELLKEGYFSLANLYEKKGDYKQAYAYHKLYSDIKDTLLNEQSSKQITEMNTKYDSEKKDKELIRKDAEISKQQAETEKQNLQRNAFIIGFALVLGLAFFIFRGYRQKQSANKLLEGKNVLIENQKQLVIEKNNKITESINYAKRIQQAILPSNELIKSFLPESFIFFRPKDIVSGDFYWFAERDNKMIIAVADCTGHGVPGAFMSMIGNTLLNEIVNVKNISKPDEILNQLNKGIVSLLHQGDSGSSTQDDGMDITILAIDKKNREIVFAGANHFSYLFNDAKYETLKGDIFSIGGMFGSAHVKFTSQKIKLAKNSTLYLFTDGFADQFGGSKNTKLLSSGFAQLLHSIQQVEMDQQLEKLICGFENWKGNNKQLDDLLVVGIRL